MNLTALFALLATYLVYWTSRLVRNVRAARATGLPVRWSPVTASNPFWILFGKRLLPVVRLLPFGLGDWTKFSTIDWHWLDRLHHGCAVHAENGDTFVTATPSGVYLHTRDPQVAEQILKKCPKPRGVARMLEVCGPNLVSSSEEDWPRHRKITVSTLSDRNNRLVWAETVRQTRQMVASYFRHAGVMTDPADDVRKLYLHVLSAVCFGVQYDFDLPVEQAVPAGHERSYRYCLETSLKDIFYLHIVPRWASRLPKGLLPSKVAEFFAASREMLQYLDEMIATCKAELRQDGAKSATPAGSNLLQITVQGSQGFISEQGDDAGGGGRRRMVLADEEVRGNLFIYSLGGHESNAHTLVYVTYLLAAYPVVQDWLAEELLRVLPQDKDEDDLGLEETFFRVFPNMPRTLAVMYETLRLYPSIIFLPKTTGSERVVLGLDGGREAVLPAGTDIWVNMCGMQVHEGIWGADAREFRPARWIRCSSMSSETDEEEFRAPYAAAASAFVAWGGGRRVCPGQRFSQAAFAATVAVLFRKHRVEVVPAVGETVEHARQRALEVVDDSYVGTTIHMRRPGEVKLRLSAR